MMREAAVRAAGSRQSQHRPIPVNLQAARRTAARQNKSLLALCVFMCERERPLMCAVVASLTSVTVCV